MILTSLWTRVMGNLNRKCWVACLLEDIAKTNKDLNTVCEAELEVKALRIGHSDSGFRNMTRAEWGSFWMNVCLDSSQRWICVQGFRFGYHIIDKWIAIIFRCTKFRCSVWRENPISSSSNFQKHYKHEGINACSDMEHCRCWLLTLRLSFCH